MYLTILKEIMRLTSKLYARYYTKYSSGNSVILYFRMPLFTGMFLKGGYYLTVANLLTNRSTDTLVTETEYMCRI